jgi:hypothetical protein
LDLVRNQLQIKYPQLPVNQPFIAIDFGDGQSAALMSSGRLFDVHKNLPSKGKHFSKKQNKIAVWFSERW